MYPLPANAKRIRYLESTGTQYIDTGITADSDLSVYVRMANSGTSWSNVNPLGALCVDPRARHHINFSGPGNGIGYFFGSVDSPVSSIYQPSDGTIFDLSVDAINRTFSVGSFSASLPSGSWTTGMTYWLFARNGTTPPQYGELRIYEAKFFAGSTLVRDYIPCRIGQTGYLFDRVSGELFGNAGTGSFVLGPDWTYDAGVIPTRMMAMGVRKKPYDAEVEYIESTGTQYIDSGVHAGSGFFAIVFDNFTSPEGSYPGCLGGSAYNRNDARLLVFWYRDGGQIFYSTGMSNVSISTGVSIGTVVIPKTAYNIPSSFQYTIGIFMPVGPSGTTTYAFPIRLRRLQFWDSTSNLVRDFIPVRVGTTGYLYDKVTKKLFGNAGTGSFVVGPDK